MVNSSCSEGAFYRRFSSYAQHDSGWSKVNKMATCGSVNDFAKLFSLIAHLYKSSPSENFGLNGGMYFLTANSTVSRIFDLSVKK